MAILPGIIVATAIQAPNGIQSSDLAKIASFGQGAVLAAAPKTGALTRPGRIPPFTRSVPGVESTSTHLWDSSIVIPTRKTLGLVLSSMTFPIEIWNTFRKVQLHLDSIAIAGSGGITIDGQVTALIGPLDSVVLTATVPSKGVATISQVVTFPMTRQDAGTSWTGGTLAVSGSRAQLFPFDPDWTDGIKEKRQFLTKVLEMRNGGEQRIALRTRPRREVSYTVFTEDELQTQLLQSILLDGQSGVIGVPWWQDRQLFEGVLPSGSTVLPVPTDYTSFDDAPMVMLWTSPMSYEVQTIQSVGPGAVVITPLTNDWGRCSICPVFSGRFPDNFKAPWITTKLARVPVTLRIDA